MPWEWGRVAQKPPPPQGLRCIVSGWSKRTEDSSAPTIILALVISTTVYCWGRAKTEKDLSWYRHEGTAES